MKRSFKNFLILTTSASIIGTGTLMALESLIGPADLFIGAVVVVLITGTAVAIKQIVASV